MSATLPLSIHLLGGFRVCVDGRWVPDTAWRHKRAAAIIKFLALEPSHRMHREQIRDILWPELDRDAQSNNLRYSLHQAREHLQATGAGASSVLIREGEMLVLGAEDSIWVDVADFEQAVAEAWRLDDLTSYERAVDLYAGDLLPEDPYEEWITGRRTSLRASFLTLLTRAGRRAQEQGQVNQAIEIFQRLVAVEPFQEDAHVALMQLYALNGQRRQALAQYDRLVHILDQELDAEPERITRALMEAIRDGLYPGKVNETPLTAAVTLTSNLPTPVGLLVGREREIAETQQMLSSSRLVTLTGPGGIGKTRLGIAVGRQVRDWFDDGVFFVALAPIRDAELVVPAVAKALDVRETAREPLIDAVKMFLRSKRMLLVLDNFEHVVEAAPVVTELLEAAPEVKALATSRMRLRLRGEREYHVPPLDLPGADGVGTGASVAEYSAVALFVQTAQHVRPDFRVVDDNAPAVASICRRLDGLPLAIELAAARMNVLPLQAILARLDHPLTFLTGGSRDLPERQQTIRDTVAWSYDLLQPTENWLLQRLSVFAGGWSLEAAEKVTISNRVGNFDVLDGLTGLVEASLVTRRTQPDGETRYGMLEVIGEYALEQLESAGDLSDARQRHAEYVAEFAAFRELLLFGPQQIETLDELEREHDNIRAALTWFVATEQAGHGLALAGRLWRFWWLHAHIHEGRRWYDALLNLPQDDVATRIRATALTGAGVLAERQYDIEAAILRHNAALKIWRSLPEEDQHVMCSSLISLGNAYCNGAKFDMADPLFTEAFELARTLNNPGYVARALYRLGNLRSYQGNDLAAMACWEDARKHARISGDVFTMATSTGNIGIVLINQGMQEALDRGVELIEEALELQRSLGVKRDIANLTFNLAWAELQRGRTDASLLYIKAGMSIARDSGDTTVIVFGMSVLGRTYHRMGDPDRALEYFREGLLLVQTTGDLLMVSEVIDQIALLHFDRGGIEKALTLSAATNHFLETVGVLRGAVEEADANRIFAGGRQALPEDVFSAAWESGYAMTLDDVIDYVLSE